MASIQVYPCIFVRIHIHLHSPVNLQALSRSVADALAYFGDPSTKETEYFVRQFDRLFDCLNVRSLSEWMQKKKPDLKPYTSLEDERLKVRSFF